MSKKRIYKKYVNQKFWLKFLLFWKYYFIDLAYIKKYGKPFSEYGVSLFTGFQGTGKTMAMVEYLERMRKLYPNVKIVTNFGYHAEDQPMIDWKDFFEIRNGEDGVIFAIDEIQNEFNSTDWKNFPESMLSEITQQRKQKVKIIASSQVFTRVAKPLREQTSEVIECYTLLGRWTWLKAFDAQEFEAVIQDPIRKQKLKRKWRKNFVQDNDIREMYDSYAKIERLKKTQFVERRDRIS
ncbi:ATP-dependent Clp protease ATP-binding subunit ClpX [Jeotgalibacillus terrae]|nr:zonular occludens toxin domain-containing protein [Jeotgalibacillus terrae]MBM7581140.1 ATP-dependent Clp protease ATP-binding subunit ClpX [Jeotgalibacillus terrae]